jgi:hypothetical protein
MNETLFAFLGTVLLVALLLDFLPRRASRGLYFGVTTGPDFPQGQTGRAIANRYRIWVWTGFLLSCGLAFASLPVAIVPLLGGFAAGWTQAWRATTPHSIQPGLMPAEPPPETTTGVPPIVLIGLIPLFILIAAAVVLATSYEQVPGSVFAPLAVGFGAYVMTAVSAWMLAFRGRVSSASRSVHLRSIVVILFAVSLLCAGISLAPLAGASGITLPPRAIIAFPSVVLLAALYPLWKLQGRTGGAGDGTPDECWKLGLIYYNPNDPALLVEKRSGLGYTLNFGHKASWIVLAIPLAAMLWPLLFVVTR